MRVIAGSLRHRSLLRPPPGVRPTSDRAREALFSSLGSIAGVRVLDLYAGTGAVGIEAISRGATEVVFVDHSTTSIAVLRENLRGLEVEERARVLEGDARAAVRRLGQQGEAFGLVFADPPYDSDEAEGVLDALGESGIVSPDGQVVVETAKRNPLASRDGWEVGVERDYGDSRLTRLVQTARGGVAPSED